MEGKLSDTELTERVQGGHEEDFRQLYERYVDKVRRKCRGMVKNNDVAEDLLQDIFLKALQNLPGFRREATFSTWLYAITYNTCIEYLRKHKRVRFSKWEDQLDLPEEVEDEEVEELMALREERLNLLMEMLKPEDKALLIMKYREGMRIKAMVEILGLNGESAVKMKLNRAKKRMVALHQEVFGKP